MSIRDYLRRALSSWLSGDGGNGFLTKARILLTVRCPQAERIRVERDLASFVSASASLSKVSDPLRLSGKAVNARALVSRLYF